MSFDSRRYAYDSYAEAQEEDHRSHSSLIIICLIAVLIPALALGGLRLYALYLEHRLSSVTHQIEMAREENIEMQERYSALLSPSRVYSYARLQLGMMTAAKTKTIHLGDPQGAQEEALRLAKEHRPSMFGFLKNVFVGKANAKD